MKDIETSHKKGTLLPKVGVSVKSPSSIVSQEILSDVHPFMVFIQTNSAKHFSVAKIESLFMKITTFFSDRAVIPVLPKVT